MDKPCNDLFVGNVEVVKEEVSVETENKDALAGVGIKAADFSAAQTDRPILLDASSHFRHQGSGREGR